jgi:hypothetical protein
MVWLVRLGPLWGLVSGGGIILPEWTLLGIEFDRRVGEEKREGTEMSVSTLNPQGCQDIDSEIINWQLWSYLSSLWELGTLGAIWQAAG